MRNKLSGKMSISRGLDGDIVHIARENTLFRKVVHTGECSQLVVMSVPPGGEVGMEHYPHTDLIFFILKGKAEMIVNSKSRTTRKYEVIFIPAGELHNLTNAGQDDLKLLAIYAPAEYLEDSVCRTQEEAEAARREALEHVWQHDVSNGYFDLVDKAVFFDRFRRCCTSDGSAMYFSGRNPQTDTDTWRCPRAGCEPDQLTTDDEERHALPSH